MAPPSPAGLQVSPAPPCAGWQLAAGRAMTLRPRHPGLLRVSSGRLWVTCDGPHAGALNDQGDHVLDAGDQLRLHAGTRWVIEAWTGNAPACFDWEGCPGAA